MKILVANAGSSSDKFALYDLCHEEPVEPLWQGSIDWGGDSRPPFLSVATSQGAKREENIENEDREKGFDILFTSLWQGRTQVLEGPDAIEWMGHRVVHGGAEFQQPTLITAAVKERIRRLFPLAPLHNPANLKGIERMENRFPGVPQLAVFDTAFHATLLEKIKTYPVPLAWKKWGIQRYGFHGISHQYCAERAAQLLKQHQASKIINCHLGNGCSLCAIKEGKSYDTTMGFTPMEGLMMGSRCGSIDPGISLYLMREHQWSVEELDKCLNGESGLKGIGGSADMRDLLARQDAQAQLAVSMFVHRLKSSIGAMAVSLGGFDALSFTGGIGENAAEIREGTCRGLACLGVAIDEDSNRTCRPDADLSAPSSNVRVLVLHTREEWMIARACFKFREEAIFDPRQSS